MLEPVVIGVLTSLTAVMAAVYWQLRVRPEALLSLLLEDAGWAADGTIDLLRWVTSILVFVFAFLTGLSLVMVAN